MRDTEAFRFGAFRLLPAQRELLLRGTQVQLGARAFDLLVALVRRRGQLATKDELMAEVWPGTVVEENNLQAQISTLRKVFAGDEGSAGCLQTASGRGYRFLGGIEDEQPADPGASTHEPEASTSQLSLVVLPFANLSSDPEQAYFAEGMSETVTTDLSRISGLLVIAFTTAAAFSARPLDVRQVCHELRVRFALKGSVQRDQDHIRVNAQLIDSRDGKQVWSERFDGDGSDLFALQDRITGRIANAIGREVVTAAARTAGTGKSDPNAIDLIMRGVAADNRPQSLESLQSQEQFFSQAARLDPQNSEALARLARAVLLQSIQMHVAAHFREEKLRDGAGAAERAVTLNPYNARAHLAAGLMHMLRGDFARAVLANETAVSLDRNLAQAHSNLGNSLVHLGKARQAIAPLEQALRLDPDGPQLGAFLSAMGLARLFLGQHDAAAECFARARASNPKLPRAHAGLAIALALKGEVAEARIVGGDLLQLVPGFRMSQTIHAPFPGSPARYQRFYEDVLMPGANLAEIPI
jgi:TolB-like protein/Flp pilus assembly protein TadD